MKLTFRLKEKNFTHQINVIDMLTIIGIDFMHKHNLHYDVQTRQVKIAGIEGDQIVAINFQFHHGKIQKDINFIASVYAPQSPMLSGMPAVASINKKITAN
jgi:hypothetical protein